MFEFALDKKNMTLKYELIYRISNKNLHIWSHLE